MQNAQETLDLMHMYVHPHRSIQQELESTLDRGVRMRLVTAGNNQTDFSPVPRAFGFFNRSYFLPLLKSGRSAEIYEFIPNSILYHKKVMIVDNRYSLIGSYNFGKKSHYGDYEVVVDIDSPLVAAQFLEAMEDDIAQSRPCCETEAKTWHEDWLYRVVNQLQGMFILGPVL